MKLLILLFSVLTAQIMIGQNIVETRTATLVDGDYILQGTVHLEAFDDGSLDLRLEDDYMTQSNVFDVHIYLSNSDDYNAPIDTSEALLVENIGSISGINYSSGAMTFELPSGVGINDYNFIVFICVQFGNLHWGNGTFSESIVSSTEDLESSFKPSIEIFPNPSANGQFKIDVLENENLSLEVLDISGRSIIAKTLEYNTSNTVYIENSGIYFFRFNSGSSSITKKVIRR